MGSTPNGFVDLQVNGGKGIGFSDPWLTAKQVKRITMELAAQGTSAYCATVITTKQEVYRENLRVIAAAMKDPEVGQHILGIHMEGPFISSEPGAVGAHPIEHVQASDITVFDKFQKWADSKIRILTVAPEIPGCLELIRYAVAQGVIVSLGHHLASDTDLDAAVAAGARLCTHVGNGMPNQIHRHKNPLWWQLANDQVSGMFITDGHHLPANLIKVALRAKVVRRFIVTSDASPLAGMPPGEYDIFGGLHVVLDGSGRIYSKQSESLAGSSSTMLECMNYLASLNLLTADELWRVGMVNPLRVLGMKPDDIAVLNGPKAIFDNNRFTLK